MTDPFRRRLNAESTPRVSSAAHIQQDVVVCLLEDGATKAERNVVAAGQAELVRLSRDAIQRAMEEQLVTTIDRLTRRRVRSFQSGTSTLCESSVEVFVLEPEAPADGAALPSSRAWVIIR
jgi:uncharacterized protein YbcI